MHPCHENKDQGRRYEIRREKCESRKREERGISLFRLGKAGTFHRRILPFSFSFFLFLFLFFLFSLLRKPHILAKLWNGFSSGSKGRNVVLPRFSLLLRAFFLSTLLSSGFIHFSPPYPPPFRICYFIYTRACLPFAHHSLARHDCLPFSSILRCFRHHPIFSPKLRLFVATAQLHLLSRELNVLKSRSDQSNETVQYNCADFNIWRGPLFRI